MNVSAYHRTKKVKKHTHIPQFEGFLLMPYTSHVLPNPLMGLLA